MISILGKSLITQISDENTKMGEIKKLAKDIKTNHELAMELWASNEVNPRLLAVLIMDKKLITQEFINDLDEDLKIHNTDKQIYIVDWLLANQLTKSKKTLELLKGWENVDSVLQRRLFWYHQARLRWTGKTSFDNTDSLMESLEKKMSHAEPEVQWAMNFLAGQIGIHEESKRERCIKLGERLGLYKDEKAPPNCTPNYLPEFIRIEVAKRTK